MGDQSCSPFPVFREYIGAKPPNAVFPIKFSDLEPFIVLYPKVQFHFILSFARDYDCNGCATNGNLSPHWDQTNFSPTEVLNIKNKHQNVKVILGIGSRDETFPFCPTNNATWASAASCSIQKIIKEYHLDGVEVNYESICAGKDDFADCIGELLRTLKEAKSELIVSIAPSVNLQCHYLALYEKYKCYIDMVDYQIYTHRPYPLTMEEFFKIYDDKKKNYDNLLVGLSTDMKDAAVQQGPVFELVISKLKAEKKLKGIFIWSADDSKLITFDYELKSVTVLGM